MSPKDSENRDINHMKHLLSIIAVVTAGLALATPPRLDIMHNWKLVQDEAFFNYIDSMLDINDSTPFIDMDPGVWQLVQSAKRYYKVVIDNGALPDSIVINDGKPHKIHITQYRQLKPDAKSTVKHKDRVYFFTVDNADVFRPFHIFISQTTSRVSPCLPGQEWEFEYTAPK